MLKCESFLKNIVQCTLNSTFFKSVFCMLFDLQCIHYYYICVIIVCPMKMNEQILFIDQKGLGTLQNNSSISFWES